MFYTMKQACELTGMTYQGLKFYCNEGLVPNVKRNISNHRVFDERDIAWIKSLLCLRDCGMGIQDMKKYTSLCLIGKSTIPERKAILQAKREEIQGHIRELEETLKYIDAKEEFYNDVLAGRRDYVSNLLPCTCI
ncbi:MAG: MerR family transcriptional regulator [Synergistaceae bacterium]|nr:MerR family transcriptional regulator [Synergistaceae bacterium]